MEMTFLEATLIWVAWVIAGGSPGPANLGIAATSMQTGRRAGLVFSLGILSGSAFLGLAAALGMGALMFANVWMFEILRWAGAMYLMVLALRALRSAWRPVGDIAGSARAGGSVRIYLRGVFLHLTNPKAILSWGAIYAVVVSPEAGLAGALGIWAFLLTGSALVFIGYAFLFSAPGVVRVWMRMRRWFDVAFAALFGAAAIKIVTTRIAE